MDISGTILPLAIFRNASHHGGMILSRDFFDGNPMDVTRRLLGCYLCRQTDDGTILRARIAEVELYLDTERGCHAFGGKCTPRNDAMFLDGGYAYVYLCYGLHNMLNIVLGPRGRGAAVLVRAVELPDGNGPGKLTRVMGITRAMNKWDLTAGRDLWLERGDQIPAKQIVAGPRIGIDYAGADAALPWRFAIAASPYLSRAF